MRKISPMADVMFVTKDEEGGPFLTEDAGSFSWKHRAVKDSLILLN